MSYYNGKSNFKLKKKHYVTDHPNESLQPLKKIKITKSTCLNYSHLSSLLITTPINYYQLSILSVAGVI